MDNHARDKELTARVKLIAAAGPSTTFGVEQYGCRFDFQPDEIFSHGYEIVISVYANRCTHNRYICVYMRTRGFVAPAGRGYRYHIIPMTSWERVRMRVLY
jgi:hypothetical protein